MIAAAGHAPGKPRGHSPNAETFNGDRPHFWDPGFDYVTPLVDLLRRYSRYDKLRKPLRKIVDATDSANGCSAQRTRTVRILLSTSSISGSSRTSSLNCRLSNEAGTPTTKLAVIFNLSKGAVLTLLHEAGISMRQQLLTAKELANARRLYESGLSLVAISERIGRHNTTVTYCCAGLAS